MFLESSPIDKNQRNLKHGNYKASGTKKIYVILTYTNTTFAKVTKFLLEQPYTHCSMALDKDLRELFSFNFSQNSFVLEDIRTNKVLQNSKFSLYSITVTEEQYNEISDKIKDMVENKNKYKYNATGLLRIFLNKPKETEEKYFCSQFVAKIIEIADQDLFKKHSSLVVPYDFARNKKFKFETRGILKNYDPRRLKDV